MCDSKGVIFKGRDNIDQFKSAHAAETKLRTLEEAMKNADVFLGLSAKDVVSKNIGTASEDKLEELFWNIIPNEKLGGELWNRICAYVLDERFGIEP